MFPVLLRAAQQTDQFYAQWLGRALAATLVLDDHPQAPLEIRVLPAGQAFLDVRLEFAAEGLVRLAIEVGPEALEQLVAVEIVHGAAFGAWPLLPGPVFSEAGFSVPAFSPDFFPFTYPARLA